MEGEGLGFGGSRGLSLFASSHQYEQLTKYLRLTE